MFRDGFLLSIGRDISASVTLSRARATAELIRRQLLRRLHTCSWLHSPTSTLHSVIEEFVTRDGTEMTDSAVKIESVLRQLRSGEVEVWFDSETQTCNILRS